MKKISFPPLCGPEAHTLILGSMPGEVSLDAHQYYAHPRNNFWPFMEDILGIDNKQSYAQRCSTLADKGFAIWDVLFTCVRKGSLDSNIRPESIEINDFSGFFADYPHIERVFFNGGKAESLYLKKALPALGPEHTGISYQRLPSTSPANASIPLEQKRAAWGVLAAQAL